MKKLFSSMRVKALVAGSLLLAIVFFAACDKNDNNNNYNKDVAGLMAFNLASDLQAGISLNGTNLMTGPLLYTTYTGGYYRVFPGNRQVRTYNYLSSSIVDSMSYNFEANKYYSLFVTGNAGNYQNIIVNDNFDSLASTAGMAYVRYVNAIPDATGNPMVTISSGGDNIANDQPAFNTVSNFVGVNAGDITVAVNSSNINASRTISLQERGVYTVLLIGMPGVTTPDSVQIRYVQNGMLDTEAGKMNAVNSTDSK